MTLPKIPDRERERHHLAKTYERERESGWRERRETKRERVERKMRVAKV